MWERRVDGSSARIMRRPLGFFNGLCNFMISIAQGTVDGGEELFRKHLGGCLLEIHRTKALYLLAIFPYLGFNSTIWKHFSTLQLLPVLYYYLQVDLSLQVL